MEPKTLPLSILLTLSRHLYQNGSMTPSSCNDIEITPWSSILSRRYQSEMSTHHGNVGSQKRVQGHQPWSKISENLSVRRSGQPARCSPLKSPGDIRQNRRDFLMLQSLRMGSALFALSQCYVAFHAAKCFVLIGQFWFFVPYQEGQFLHEAQDPTVEMFKLLWSEEALEGFFFLVHLKTLFWLNTQKLTFHPGVAYDIICHQVPSKKSESRLLSHETSVPILGYVSFPSNLYF